MIFTHEDPTTSVSRARGQYGPDSRRTVELRIEASEPATGTSQTHIPFRAVYISFDTATSQRTGAELAADVSWKWLFGYYLAGATAQLALTTERPDFPARSLDWRAQLSRLSRWRGDVTVGEVGALSPYALHKAEVVAALTEQTARALPSAPVMHMVPLYHGGVLCEWTHRGGTRIEHFEIGTGPGTDERYEVLATQETLDGTIDQVLSDVESATLLEVLGRFGQFLERVSVIS